MLDRKDFVPRRLPHLPRGKLPIYKIKGCVVDRCVLYTFRGAVYFAETENPEPELMKWLNWKDRSWNES